MRLKKLAQKLLLTGILGTTFLTNASFGQIKLEGPTQIEPGELGKINIGGIEGLNDPKIQCFPENNSWEAVKRLDGSPFILFYTKKEGIYTFVVAGNKDNKTVLSVIQVIVGKIPVPVPPAPGPVNPGKYTQRLSAPYKVSPDNVSLTKLIEIYQEVGNNSGNMSSYKQVMDTLALSTGKVLVESTLRGVRDEVANILQADLANRASQAYNSEATKAIFLEIAKSLTPLLEPKGN